MEMTRPKIRTKDIAYIAVFVAVLAVCSWITVPTTVPFTLQTLGIFLAVGVLGGQRGILAILAYLLLGLVGAPVFSGFGGGVSAFFTPSGGYLVGFLFSALAMWALERFWRQKPLILALSMVLGLLVCYAFGTAWFMVVYPMGGETVSLLTALTWCVFPFLLFDALKIALAFGLSLELRRHVK